MKLATLLLCCLSLPAAAMFAADQLAKTGPSRPIVVTCFNGKIDSANSCSWREMAPPKSGSDEEALPEMSCGAAPHVSRIHWEYLGSKDGADYYRITRRFPAGSRDATTVAKTIKFTGDRVVAFEDQYQVIVIDPGR